VVQTSFEAGEVFYCGLDKTLDSLEQFTCGRKLEAQLARGTDSEARWQGGVRYPKEWWLDASGARFALHALQSLDHRCLALGLGTGYPAVLSHLLQPGKQFGPVDHLGSAKLVAVVDSDQIVGLAAADAEELFNR